MFRQYNDSKIASDLVLWLICLVITLVVVIGFGYHWYHVNHDLNPDNNLHDQTHVITVITVLFGMGLLANVVNTLNTWREHHFLDSPFRGLMSEHIANLERALSTGNRSTSQDFSLEVLRNRLHRRESWVQLIATLLVTLGMIGTVVGLIISFQSLSEAINYSVPDQGQHARDLHGTLSRMGGALEGMSTAFITTLSGALMGGLFLKALSHASGNLIEDLIDNIQVRTELYVIPPLMKDLGKDNRQFEVETRIRQMLDNHLNQLTWKRQPKQAGGGDGQATDEAVIRHLVSSMDTSMSLLHGSVARLNLFLVLLIPLYILTVIAIATR